MCVSCSPANKMSFYSTDGFEGRFSSTEEFPPTPTPPPPTPAEPWIMFNGSEESWTTQMDAGALSMWVESKSR